MSSLKQRFILAGLALPALIAAVLYLPYFNYAAIGIASSIFSGLGALEISRMFSRRNISIHPTQAFLSGAILPAVRWVDASEYLSVKLFSIALLLSLGALVARQACIFSNEKLKGALKKTAASCMLVVYPGLFMSYIIRICSFDFPALSLLLFFSLVFVNDSLAYATGMLFGSGNRNIFAASPNKSAAGLIGGFTGALGAAYIYYAFRPDLFLHNVFIPIPIALLSACAANIGDLSESAMKRSAEVKDSGTLMKGRGGVMDTIDSILYTAPVFYYTMAVFTSRGQLW